MWLQVDWLFSVLSSNYHTRSGPRLSFPRNKRSPRRLDYNDWVCPKRTANLVKAPDQVPAQDESVLRARKRTAPSSVRSLAIPNLPSSRRSREHIVDEIRDRLPFTAREQIQRLLPIQFRIWHTQPFQKTFFRQSRSQSRHSLKICQFVLQ